VLASVGQLSIFEGIRLGFKNRSSRQSTFFRPPSPEDRVEMRCIQCIGFPSRVSVQTIINGGILVRVWMSHLTPFQIWPEILSEQSIFQARSLYRLEQSFGIVMALMVNDTSSRKSDGSASCFGDRLFPLSYDLLFGLFIIECVQNEATRGQVALSQLSTANGWARLAPTILF